MFISKKEKWKILEICDVLTDKLILVNNRIPKNIEIVDCETCGCMVKKELAVKGGNVVKKDFDHTPYYCKRCAPVKKVKK